MTILCITTTGIPGIRPCTVRGVHRVTCQDHPGWTDNPGTCTGCLPREARVGFLCWPHHERVQAAYAAWPNFRAALEGVDRTVKLDNAGVRTSSEGYIPLPGTLLAIDECERLLASFPSGPRAFDMWISTPEGARDAVMFARAAEAAYRSHQIEEREAQLQRVRCPRCGQLTLIRQAPALELEPVRVTCDNEHCRHVIREGDEAHLYEQGPDGWRTVTADAVDVIDAIERRSA